MSRLAVLALLAAAPLAAAADAVPVRGSSASFPPSVAVPAGDKTVQVKLTGVGLRTRLGFRVYAIGSYLQDGATVRSAEELARADAVRMLYLVMERTVEPADFIGAFKSAVGKSHPADRFAAEFEQLTAAIGATAAAKGDHVSLVSVPGSGVRVQIVGKVDATIKNPAFAQALWEVFLGPNPLDEGLKAGLVGRLPR